MNETQKGDWRERFDTLMVEQGTVRLKSLVYEDDHQRYTLVVDSSKIRSFIEAELAAQETAFKERVRNADPGDIPHEMVAKGISAVKAWRACRQEVLTRIERLSR